MNVQYSISVNNLLTATLSSCRHSVKRFKRALKAALSNKSTQLFIELAVDARLKPRLRRRGDRLLG